MDINYRRAEGMLYNYKKTFAQWHDLLADIETLRAGADVRVQTYSDLHLSDGQEIDPAADFVNRLMNMERLAAALERKVRVIETVRTTLESSTDERDQVKRQIMEYVYFEDAGMMELAVHLGQNYRTLYRRRRELVQDVITAWEDEKHDKSEAR